MTELKKPGYLPDSRNGIPETVPAPRPRSLRRADHIENAVLYVIAAALLAGFIWYFMRANQHLENKLLDSGSVSGLLHQDSSASESFYHLQTRVAGLRYRHAAYALYGQETRRSGGFLIGSIVLLVGTLLVVRRIEIAPFAADTSAAENIRMQIRTTSPGLFLSSLGTLIVLTALIVPTEVAVIDELGSVARAVAKAESDTTTSPNPDSVVAP